MPAPDPGLRPFLSAVVLAAGASQRMGRAKQLLPLGDRPLLQHVLDAVARSCLDELILVLGSTAPEVLAGIDLPAAAPSRVVVNDDPAAGQSRSLRLGLRGADRRAAAVAIFLGDQPGVTGPTIDRVAEAFLAGRAPVARPVYSVSRGIPVPGHPVLVARRVWPQVEKLRGDQGMRGLLARNPDWLLQVATDGEPPGDIDTWEDYRRAAGGGG